MHEWKEASSIIRALMGFAINYSINYVMLSVGGFSFIPLDVYYVSNVKIYVAINCYLTKFTM